MNYCGKSVHLVGSVLSVSWRISFTFLFLFSFSVFFGPFPPNISCVL